MSAICDIYVVDLRNWSIVIASSGLDGTYSDGPSSQPVLSGDGRFVVFRTDRAESHPGWCPAHQIMLRDRDADQDGIFDEPSGRSHARSDQRRRALASRPTKRARAPK